MISFDYCDGDVTRCDLSPDQIHALRETSRATRKRAPRPAVRSKPMLWVDVVSPTEEDWTALHAQFDFHPLALEDARKQNQRPKVDSYGDYLFLSLRAWAGGEERASGLGEITREVDVFLGPDYLVTVRGVDGGPVRETRRRLRENPEYLRSEPAFVLYLLLDALVDEYFPAMDALDEDIDRVEMAIYESDALPDFKPAVLLKRRLLLLRQAVSPLRDVLNELLRIDDPALISPEVRVFYQDVYDHALRLVEQVDLHRDIMGGVMDVLMSQTSNRLNQVMKTLTGISTILMSAALIAGIYGMNFKVIPELGWRFGYFYALGLMAAIAFGLTIYFKKIKWF